VTDLLKNLIEAWDEMDRASASVLTAQPSSMTERADRLEKARLKMRDVIHTYAVHGVGA
jgi:uncharacterized protein YdcH (DUF465 family)